MTVIQLKTRVPESREVTLTLPPDVPVGEAELQITICPSGDAERVFEVVLPPEGDSRAVPPRPTHPKLAAEYDAFQAMLPELMSRYAGKYVAFHEGAVVAEGDTEVDTLTTAYAVLPGVLVLVRRVSDRPERLQRLPVFRPVPAG